MYAVENTYTCIIIYLIPDFFDFLPLKNAVSNFMEPHKGLGEEEKRGNETIVEAKCSRQARGDLYFKCKHAIEEEVELNCYTCKYNFCTF